MERLIPIIIVGLFVVNGFGTTAFMNNKLDIEAYEGKTSDITHTVFAEFGTGTWCGYCKFAHNALKNIYAEGNYDFYYVSLVEDKNEYALDRIDEYNIYGFPTVWFDGGYQVDVGALSVFEAQEKYESSLSECEGGDTYDIYVNLDVEWLGDAEMIIDVSVGNNDFFLYDGNLRIYVTEIESSMGWDDTGGNPYTFTFLNYACNQEVNIDSGDEWSDSITWDGDEYGFGDISAENIMIIAVVFSSDWHQGYSNPPSSNPFDAYYVDDVAAFSFGDNDPPFEPSNPDPINGETYVDLNKDLSWTGGDPNVGDIVTYDVYLGTTDPPIQIATSLSDTTFDPGFLSSSTKFYWKVVATDDKAASTESPLWTFTTRPVSQIILNEGWNLISFNLKPDNMGLLDIVQPLIDEGSLEIIQDEGTGIIWPAYGIDTIGNMNITEGYKVKVNQNTTLFVTGTYVELPVIIPLNEGWNTIGYPMAEQQDALELLQPLIAEGSLIQVIDENNLNIYHNTTTWVNEIGSFQPNEGYHIKVNSDTSLLISDISITEFDFRRS